MGLPITTIQISYVLERMEMALSSYVLGNATHIVAGIA